MLFVLSERILLMVHWLKIYLTVLFFGVVSYVIVVDTVFTQTSFDFYWFYCPSFKFSHQDLWRQVFNRMFDLEFPKFRTNLERIYGWQPLELVNVNTTFENVFNNLQSCPIAINVVNPRAILVWWQMWQQWH